MKEDFYNINDDLLVRYLLRESSPSEHGLVEKWILANESNRKYYKDLVLIWNESKRWGVQKGVDENAAWQRFHNRIHDVLPVKTVKKSLPGSMGWLRVAASAILVLAGGWIGYIFVNQTSLQTVALTSKNGIVSDTLPDGSVVMLNKYSDLKYAQKRTGNTRSVVLQGEAFFSVSPHKNKPFIIHTNGIRITVVGTSFNVKTTVGNTEIIVETGIVQVTSKNNSVRLISKEKLTLRQDDAILVKEPVTDKLYNYYRTREFVCDNTPLWKLVEVLNQAYDTNIVIARKELRTLPLTTVFNNESLDSILTIISETFNITIERAGKQIVLK